MKLRLPNVVFAGPRRGKRIVAKPGARHSRRSDRPIAVVVAGERLESRALLAVSAAVKGGELAIRCGAANDVVTLTAYDKYFTVTGTGLDTASFWNTAVLRISVSDSGGTLAGQTLIVGGSVPVTRPLAVSNIEKTLLGTSVVNAALAGDVVFGGPVLLPSGRPVTIRNTQGGVFFNSTIDGETRLTIDAPNRAVGFKGRVGGATPLTGLWLVRANAVNADATVAIDGKGSATADGIVFGAGVGSVKMAAVGSSVKACRFGIVVEASAPPQATVSRQLAGFNLSGNMTGVRFRYAEGVTYSGGKAGFHSWTVTNSVFKDNVLHGIHLTADSTGAGDVRKTVFSKNIILRSKGDGIRVETPAGDMSIRENIFIDNGRSEQDAAIRLVGGGSSYTPTTSVRVSSNVISMTVPANGRPTPVTGIFVRNMRQLSASGNIIRDASVGMSLSGSFVSDYTALDNVIERPRRAGIVLDSAQYAQVAGNSVYDGQGVGLLVTGLCTGSVVGSTKIQVFQNNAAGGVVLQSARNIKLLNMWATYSKVAGVLAIGDCAGTQIDGVESKWNTTGIVVQAASGLTIRNSAFVQNSGNGLIATGNCPSTIMWSQFSNNKTNGLVLAGARGLQFVGPGGQSTANSNAVHGLVASGDCKGTKFNGWYFVNNASSGVVLDNAAGLAVFGCMAQANKANGLLALGACTDSTVAASQFASNGYGVVLSAAQGLAVVGGNTVTSNAIDGLYATGDCAGSTFGVNTVSANVNAGLGLYDARKVTVTGNTVMGNKAFGLFANGISTGSTVSGNTISGSLTNVSVTATGGNFQKG
jgi:parallel beta-helix repeat protein